MCSPIHSQGKRASKKIYLCVFVCVRVHAFVSACMCVCEPARALLRVMCVKG